MKEFVFTLIGIMLVLLCAVVVLALHCLNKVYDYKKQRHVS